MLPSPVPEFKKNMNDIVANAYRPGYSIRSFANSTVMNHRTDNVGRLVENLNYRTESQGVDYNINFNINKVDLVSRLNSHFHEVMLKKGRQEDLVAALRRDYSVSKRQYAIYLVDCYDETLKELCAGADVGRMQSTINNMLSA